MPVVHHENDHTALSRLKPSEWVWLKDEGGVVHRAFSRVLYFGTQTHYTMLCGLETRLDPEEPVSGPTTCMVCLSNEPHEADMEKALGSSIPRPTKTRRVPVKRRGAGARRAR
jgi:hypothetical protein